MLHRLLIAILLLTVACAAHCDPPKVTSVVPPGVTRGTSAVLLLEGVGLTGSTVFVSGSSIEVGKTQPAPGGVRVRVTVGAGASIGPHELRVASALGVSNSSVFWIGPFPQMSEIEPNDEPHPMQVPSAISTISGRMDRPGDADHFEFDGKSGDSWVVDCVASAIGSAMVPRFEVRDGAGELVAQGEAIRGRDPRVLITLPHDGKYTVKLSDVNGGGGAQYPFLLTIARAPVVQDFTPHAERPGKTVGLVIRGANLGGTSRAKVIVPQDARAAVWFSVPTARGPSVPFLFPISDEPAIGITESDQTMSLPAIPSALEGKLEVYAFARFYFDADAGEHLQFGLQTRSVGSKLEATLLVIGPDGRAVSRSSPDSLGADEGVSFSAETKGRYIVEMRSKGDSTGLDRYYRLEVRREEPGFDATVERSELTVKAGERILIPVSIQRLGGFTGTVTVTGQSLPKGIQLKARSAVPSERRIDVEMTLDREAPRKPFLLRMRAVGRVEGRAIVHLVRPVSPEGLGPRELIPVVVLPPATPTRK